MKKRTELDTPELIAVDASNEHGSLYVTVFVNKVVPDDVTAMYHEAVLKLTDEYFGKAAAQ